MQCAEQCPEAQLGEAVGPRAALLVPRYLILPPRLVILHDLAADTATITLMTACATWRRGRRVPFANWVNTLRLTAAKDDREFNRRCEAVARTARASAGWPASLEGDSAPLDNALDPHVCVEDEALENLEPFERLLPLMARLSEDLQRRIVEAAGGDLPLRELRAFAREVRRYLEEGA